MSASKAADKNARLIACHENGDEIELHGSKDLTGNTEANQETVNQFIEEPKINKSNQLTGLVLLRSDKSFKEIKKNQLTQKVLNNNPRIFLTANHLDVVTPVVVGFFINTTPRPDKPEVFTNRLKQFTDTQDDTTKTQVEYGPIWAPNHRVSVFKLMTAFDDMDKVRYTMNQYKPGLHDDIYICMMEFSSLSDAQKIKMTRCQAEYSTNIRSLFLTGIKSIQGTLTPIKEGGNNQSVSHWIHDRMTS